MIIRKEELYNILMEFDVLMKLVKLITIFLYKNPQ
jgi:hypothetical protein